MTLFSLNSLSEEKFPEQSSGVVDVVLAARRKKKSPGPDVKLILQVVLALVFVLSLVMFDDVASGDTASLTLYLGDHARVFVGDVVPGMTVLDAINAAAIAGNIKFSFMSNGSHAKIVNIGGVIVASESERYVIFLNSEKLNPDDVGTTQVKIDDSIVFKLLPAQTK